MIPGALPEVEARKRGNGDLYQNINFNGNDYKQDFHVGSSSSNMAKETYNEYDYGRDTEVGCGRCCFKKRPMRISPLGARNDTPFRFFALMLCGLCFVCIVFAVIFLLTFFFPSNHEGTD